MMGPVERLLAAAGFAWDAQPRYLQPFAMLEMGRIVAIEG
jgi:hypothetical protein